MKVRVRNSWEKRREFAEISVFIDVFRASTTVVYLLKGKAEEVLSVNDEGLIEDYRRAGYITVSEVLKDSEYDNSPTKMRDNCHRNKKYILKTGNLTESIFANIEDTGIGLIGCFANIGSLTGYILGSGAESVDLIVCGHHEEKKEAIEDISCAELLGDMLMGHSDLEIPFMREIEEKIEKRKKMKDIFPPHYWFDLEMALRVSSSDIVPGIEVVTQGVVRYVDLRGDGL